MAPLPGPGRPEWDSSERRTRLAETLQEAPDREAANARIVADIHQGTRPSAAMNTKPTVARLRKMQRSRERNRTVKRGGVGW